MGDVDLDAWLSERELERCSACGEATVIRFPASGARLCLSCGTREAPEDDEAIDVLGRSQEHS
jgi:hypothetical protein